MTFRSLIYNKCVMIERNNVKWVKKCLYKINDLHSIINCKKTRENMALSIVNINILNNHCLITF